MPAAAILLALMAAPAAAAWTRGKSTSVSVDPGTFAYRVSTGAGASECALATGYVALNCDGKHYSSTDGGLKLAGVPGLRAGTDPNLGAFEAIGASWASTANAAACSVHTEIRYFAAVDAIVFVANFSATGVPRTNTSHWQPGEALLPEAGMSTAGVP